jgi:hypothetical protein
MELVLDVERFTYPGLWAEQVCWCRLRVYRQPGMARLLMVATERADNPGASITNAAEGLWSRAWAEFMPDHGKPPLAFEHYGAESYPGGRPEGETVDLVEFREEMASRTEVAGVRWTAFSPALLNRMVGHAVIPTPEEVA